MTQETPRHNVQELIDDARKASEQQAETPGYGCAGLPSALAKALEIEAMDRVHAEEALRRYGRPAQEEPAPEHYEDTLEVKANIDTVGIISLKLPIRLADESGSPDIERAFNLAQNIVDAALELAAEDEAEEDLADVIELNPAARLRMSGERQWGQMHSAYSIEMPDGSWHDLECGSRYTYQGQEFTA